MGKPYAELDYLIKKYAISYANSLSLYLSLYLNDISEDITEECLAFSYTDSLAIEEGNTVDMVVLRDQFQDLPGARKEVHMISQLFPGKYFFGAEANEKNFKLESGNYSMVHLALHGEMNDEKPLQSRLIFSPDSRDTTEDNSLFIKEIYNMRLTTELAVLSACDTGTGQITSGEGVLSLGRAFQYSGVKSLIMSKWKVDDRTAPEVMQRFYQYLRQGQDKNEALRSAKLDFLANAGDFRSHPYYWSNFVLVGDTEQLSDQNSSKTVILYLLVILAIVSMSILGYRRTKKRSLST